MMHFFSQYGSKGAAVQTVRQQKALHGLGSDAAASLHVHPVSRFGFCA